jgi:hypothetical protein
MTPGGATCVPAWFEEPSGRAAAWLRRERKGLTGWSRLAAGSALPLIGSLLNFLVHRLVFRPATFDRWLSHNVEEAGHFERFLTRLYAAT